MGLASQSEVRSAPLHALTAWGDARPSHGFLGRIGGVSEGPFAGLNFSYLAGDDKVAVDANWELFRESLPFECSIVRLHQVHGNAVRTINAGDGGIVGPGDGLVTAVPGIALCVLSADCVPILMADAESRVIGALHAGWRGVMADIATSGVQSMLAFGAAAGKLRAALGPAIGGCCFEVEEELAERFGQRFPGAAVHIRAGRPGKAFVDLKGILRDRLIACGLPPDAISSVGPCTRCESDKYFSRRAAKEDGKTGLQLSYIALKPHVTQPAAYARDL